MSSEAIQLPPPDAEPKARHLSVVPEAGPTPTSVPLDETDGEQASRDEAKSTYNWLLNTSLDDNRAQLALEALSTKGRFALHQYAAIIGHKAIGWGPFPYLVKQAHAMQEGHTVAERREASGNY